MQGNRGGRDPFFDFGDPFASFGGFGSFGGGSFGGHRSLLSGFFGGRDPFDDPFFTRPFGGMFELSIFGPTGNPFPNTQASGFLEHQAPPPNYSRGPIIEELNSDNEIEEDKEEEKNNHRKHGRSSNEPYVEDPDDEVEGRKSKHIQYMNNFNRVNTAQPQPQTQSFTFQSSTVSYGGPSGAYYTSSRTRRAGSDGLTFEESKEANTATGQATHEVARGIHDKGHMVTRKLNSDGRVDTMQTLRNLNEDELSGFEETWKGKARKHLPGWSEGQSVQDVSGGAVGQIGPAGRVVSALPSSERSQSSRGMTSGNGERPVPLHSKHSRNVKADVGSRTGSSREKPRSAGSFSGDRARRRH